MLGARKGAATVELGSLTMRRKAAAPPPAVVPVAAEEGKKAPAVGAGKVAAEEVWEVRPGGMLVQKRRGPDDDGVVEAILVRVSAGCGGWQHDVSIDATATFGDLKVLLSLATGLWPREQRLLYRGRERDDGDHLHMAGVQDKDKVLLLEDPAVTERKLRSTTLAQLMGVPCHSFIQV